MSSEVCCWWLEFLVRKNSMGVTETLIKKLIRATPLPQNSSSSSSSSSSCLKKTILLQILQSDVSKANITESTLETLELIEELHRCDNSPVTPSMRAAYCAVALECTLKYLQSETSVLNNPLYLNAIETIWRGRVHYMDPTNSSGGSLLFSQELKHWTNQLEASLLDTHLPIEFADYNTRRDAIIKVKDYLAQAWAHLGPSFLDLAASLLNKNKQNVLNLVCDAQPSNRDEGVGGPSIPTHTNEFHGNDLGASCSTPPQNQHIVAPAEIQEENETTAAIVVEQVGPSKTCGKVCTGVDETDLPETCRKVGTSGEEMDPPKTCGKVDSLPPRPEVQEETLVKDPQESRFHLPSPKRKIVSPLKKYEPVNVTKRRKPKKWSALEEDTLKSAVNKVGEGNWKLILNSHLDIFSERTPTDLKDKWRNMTRYGGI